MEDVMSIKKEAYLSLLVCLILLIAVVINLHPTTGSTQAPATNIADGTQPPAPPIPLPDGTQSPALPTELIYVADGTQPPAPPIPLPWAVGTLA